jgi:hypothetical protein
VIFGDSGRCQNPDVVRWSGLEAVRFGLLPMLLIETLYSLPRKRSILHFEKIAGVKLRTGDSTE